MAGKDPTSVKALHEVEKRLNCAVCLDVFTEPKSLPCCHAFCKQCLGHLALRPQQGGGYVLSCPICRSQVPLPEGGVAGFPSAFHLNDLLELRQQLIKLSESKTVACENCVQHDASGFCRQCGTFLCRKCTEAHLLLSRLFPNHEIVGLKEVISNVSQLIPVKQPPIMECSTHKRPLDIYCERCAVLVCQHCTVRHHKDHERDAITDDRVYQKHLQQIQKLIPPAKEKLAAIREAVQEFVTRSENMVRNKERVKKEIKDRGQHLITEYTASVQECVRHLIEELEEGATEKLGFLASHKEEAETAGILLESCLDYVEEEVRLGSRQRILANKVQMVDRMEQVTSQVKVESLNPAEEADFVYDADKQVANMPRSIGRVSFSTLARRCTVMEKGVMTAMANEQTSFQLAIKPSSTGVLPTFPISLISCQLTPNGSCPSDCDVKETSHGVYKVTYTPTDRVPYWLRVRVGGVQIPQSPFPVRMTLSPAMRDTPVRTIAQLGKPFFVDRIGDDKLVVTVYGRHRVVILDKSGTKIMSFGRHGSGDGEFQHPTGIAVTPDNHILVADRNNARIEKFSINGRFIAAVGEQGSGEHSFDCPQSVVVHPSGKVLVADRKNHRIQVLNADLSWSHSIGSHGPHPGELKSPYDMSTDSEGLIYVADCGNHRVQKFTLQGEFVAQFSGGMNYPSGITIDANNILYVSNEHFIAVFDANGKFQRKFGKYGSEEDQFDSPYGMLMDRNGDLYICDCKNNRIVVY